ncbi:MAG: hypothetical protein RL553_357 [Planctomycetota bacterium]|jgi:hypothetical protein
MKNKQFAVYASILLVLNFSEVNAQSSGSGNPSESKPSVRVDRVDPRLQGKWKVQIAQMQDPRLAVIFKQGVIIADVDRSTVLPTVGNELIKVERCDYTLDINGRLSQIIQLDNGIIWGVSPQPGTTNYLLQVVRKIDGKEIGRLLFYVVD